MTSLCARWKIFTISACACLLSSELMAADRYVRGGQSLQEALNNAVSGDTITLEAGATFTGSFVLPYKPGTGWITIQSSMADALPEGKRVSPAQAQYMAKIMSPNNQPAITAEAGAHHYRLIGLELTSAPGQYTLQIALLGTGYENTTAQLPYSLELDRLYIHGDPETGGKRGIALNSRDTTVSNSYISDFKSTWQDSQAIMCWNGEGPFRIVNNYLEASGENIMFGGATSRIYGLIPSDIEIRNNYFFKPLSWKVGHPSYGGTEWLVKNLLELKIGRRVTIDGNVFENNWPHAQSGSAIMLTVRTENGRMPWAVVEDVTFSNNTVRNAVDGFKIMGSDGPHGGSTRRLTIRNNVFEELSSAFMHVQGTCNDLVVDHNTIFQKGTLVLFSYSPSSGFVYTNNISSVGSYGIFADGGGQGTTGLNKYAPGSLVTANVISGANASMYPAGNYFPSSLNEVSFVDRGRSDYRLAENSRYRHLGTDGKDLGATRDGDESTPPTKPPSPGPPPPVPPPSGGSATALWNTTPVLNEPWRDDRPVTLGVKIRSDKAGRIMGIRFWKDSPRDNDTHIGLLYSSTGTLLAQATFTGESARGWQQVTFATPVAITPGVTYVAAYYTTSGWSADGTYFLHNGVDAPPLHASKSGVDGPNGMYSYGEPARFPVTSRGANYWVDVMFAAD
jgi:hypothetical protein